MDRTRRARSKSRGKKAPPATSKSPVGRGRPRKTPAPAPPKREPSRRRGRPLKNAAEEKKASKERSRSRSRGRSSSRRRTIKKKEDLSLSDDETPLIEMTKKTNGMFVVLDDIAKGNSLDDVVRRSIERELISPRRSARITEKFSSRRAEMIEEVVKTSPKKEAVQPKKELGGTVGALFSVLALAGIASALLLGCTKEQCTLKFFHVPRNPHFYLGIDALLGVVAFLLVQIVLAALPIGRVIKYNGQELYRANGMLALVLTLAAVAGMWYRRLPVTMVYERHVKATVAAYIIAFLLSIALYIKGGLAALADRNPFGNTGSRIYDFIIGRQLHPIIFSRVNIKIVLLRTCLIGSLVIDALLALKAYEVRKEVSPTLGVLILLRTIYALDSLWFEDAFATTFESQYEGVGLLQVQGMLLFPFFSAVLPRFVLAHRVELSNIHLGISAIVFLVGYTIYRGSNLQKSTFRSNPLAPAVTKLETIPTNRGKKLLVGGWWGFVKHPNYLGDIILQWAIASTIGAASALPYTIPAVTTIFLLHRARRDAVRCRDRYRAAWEEYDRRVPYSIIPYVY